jgi:hypothetical protein
MKFILFVILVWALCCGVTWNGKHHSISCSCDHGVGVHTTHVKP